MQQINTRPTYKKETHDLRLLNTANGRSSVLERSHPPLKLEPACYSRSDEGVPVVDETYVRCRHPRFSICMSFLSENNSWEKASGKRKAGIEPSGRGLEYHK